MQHALKRHHTDLIFWKVREAQVVHEVPAIDRETKRHQLSVRLLARERRRNSRRYDSSKQASWQCNNKVTDKLNLDVITWAIYFQRTYLIARPVMRERDGVHESPVSSQSSIPSPFQPRLCILEYNSNTEGTNTTQWLDTKKKKLYTGFEN